MDETRHNETQKQALSRSKTGKRVAEQARAVEEERRRKQDDFASGRKRYTEGK